MLFNKTIHNIIRNFTSCETITFDDRDPSLITSRIKEVITDKNVAFNRFGNKKGFVNNSSNLERFSSLQNKLSSLIETSKPEYFSKIAKTLSDPSISSKTYWSILLVFLLFFMKTNFLLTSEKRLSYLKLSLPINAHWSKILVCFLLTVKVLQINPYLTLPLLTTTLGKYLKA